VEQPDDPRDRPTRWVLWALLAACALLLAPMLPAVMLAVWFAALTRGAHVRLSRALGDRRRLSAGLTLAAFTLVLVPFVLVATSLAADAYELVVQLLRSPRGKQVLEKLVARDGSAPAPSNVWDIAMSQQERAWGILMQVAGTATRVVIDLVVILAGAYAVLVEGGRAYAWFEEHAPMSPALLRRLRDAFYETGRGLFIGIGGAGLLQALVATIAYLALSVPSALELGVLTFVFSLIPVVGTAVVWIPVAAGLALTGRTGAAIILAICGIAVIGTVDNLVRPMLARRGHLQLPTYVVLVAMFAGVQVIGAWGLFVAPLAVRMAKAALETR
jgi:predicted PurR-regulated permease PerM